VLHLHAVRRFGDEARVIALSTARAANRRALKGALLVLAVALAFVALAKPQYGRGTRLIPATNLDVVLVLDYSKSMYARDVTPSRIVRAKAEVGRLIQSLPGARFAAIAFAGQPMSFPLTSDGGAIAQFFRQLSPNDMPVGGTAIARALEAGRELLTRDPLSKKHRRVMVLVTDGEDLEGDPVSVAEAARAEQITVHVVQIGGRTPEPIPDVDESGSVTGWRLDDQGQVITTQLSADGEAQLAKIAEVTGARVVRSQQGETGILEIASALKRMMSDELSERVETVYADVFMYPLALAVLLLLIETFVPESRRRKLPVEVPPPEPRRRTRKPRRDGERAAAAAALGLCAVFGAGYTGCERSDGLFMRNAPEVNEAIVALDAGDASAAVGLLEQYLSTGKCEGGQLGTPERVRTLYNASFDLGLGLFEIAEQFGARFGDEDTMVDDGGLLTPQNEALMAQRREQVECALRIVRLVAADPTVLIELRARAHYLAGNLEFLRRDYRSAISSYELTIELIPGLPGDAGDGIGRDAAWNRAIALRRQEEEDNRPDASPDTPDGSPEGGDGGPPEAGSDGSQQPDAQPQNDQPDAGDDGGSPSPDDQGQDAGRDGGAEPPPAEPQSSPSVNQDERMLDMLERAPSVQQQDAKNRALTGRPRSTTEDK
jgi:Ca-activated chloride channel family protein